EIEFFAASIAYWVSGEASDIDLFEIDTLDVICAGLARPVVSIADFQTAEFWQVFNPFFQRLIGHVTAAADRGISLHEQRAHWARANRVASRF
ncbi:MAG: hypothetical protein AAFR27_07660, partial [Pseudomonadota bacterium]